MPRRHVVPSLFPPPGYAHAAVVEAGERLVFTAGGVPLDAEGELVGPGDRPVQTRRVLANLDAALREAGSALEHVVATEVYVVAERDEDLYAVWDEVRASGLSTGPHASTLLGIARLGYPGQLVEITAVATVPERP
ncbi:RidA family protein [Streptomyces sp. GSL17-111]|uniref:RidA family protein n=1 Tax=Streptomyces sp. GSL17-111 TaxID=3121596 RepID=UPI0030F43769